VPNGARAAQTNPEGNAMFGFGDKQKADATGGELFQRILLVVDGSDASMAAAHFGVRLAVQMQTDLTAVYVVDTATMDYLMQMRIFVTDEREEFERDLERTGTRYLDYVSTIAGKQNVTVEKVLKRGAFHQVILQHARQMEADLIVLGGWKRTVTRKDATSVERQRILDETECPVLVIKAAQG